MTVRASHREVLIGPHKLPGILDLPRDSSSIVIFAHGSGSSRHSPRNQEVADALTLSHFATLLFDLLTPDEELDRRNVFDIPLLSSRLVEVVASIRRSEFAQMKIGFFGASTGAAAALLAAAELGTEISAIVSRGGRPDLAGASLSAVVSPTLLIVGERDSEVLELNRYAYEQLGAPKRLTIVPRATHLFEEAGALEVVTDCALAWFDTYLTTHNAAGE